jgi:spore coat polysaccharide biosynthesis protein SpsF
MKTVAIIQARMGSTRLPGKVLLDLAGEPMLARVVTRVQRAGTLDQVCVATSVGAQDDPIVSLCADLGVDCFRGPEDDVLDRYLQAANWAAADVVVRITSDCPLIDPEVIDQVVDGFWRESPDYASNTLERCWPRGLDTEAFSMNALETAGREAREPYERAHVTPFFYRNPERFRLLPISGPFALGDHRWTVDEIDDLEMVREVYAAFDDGASTDWRSILDLLKTRPEIAAKNRSVAQKGLECG